MHILERRQAFTCSAETLWQFISRPENLNAITPPDLDFEIRSNVPERMYDGLLIEYRVRIPVLGKQGWVTEIKHIRDGISFVDEQRFGPYRFWFHYHEVIPTDAGADMIDRVHYVAPFGVLGRMVETFFIRKTLKQIFDFRRERLHEMFN